MKWRRTYRESLQNNRDTILLQPKSMAYHPTLMFPFELNVEAMHAGEPDLDLAAPAFSELEFTSLLRELLPEVQVTKLTTAKPIGAEVEMFLLSQRGTRLAFAVESEPNRIDAGS